MFVKTRIPSQDATAFEESAATSQPAALTNLTADQRTRTALNVEEVPTRAQTLAGLFDRTQTRVATTELRYRRLPR